MSLINGLELPNAQATYIFRIVNDKGELVDEFSRFFFLNYTRIVNGIGICNIGFPWENWRRWQPDYRLEVWRSPAVGVPKRLDGTFFQRKARVYTRVDGIQVMELTGRSPMHLLDRRIVCTKAESAQSDKTDFIDDMMKEIVYEQMGAGAVDPNGAADLDRVFPTAYFRIQGDLSLGDSTTKSFAFRNVLDVLRELHETSATLGNPIYFDIVPITPDIFEFQTFQDCRGVDRTDEGIIFSEENDNLRMPEYVQDRFDERNVVYVGGPCEAAARNVQELLTRQVGQSIWNRIEMFKDARNESTAAGQRNRGRQELALNKHEIRFNSTFLNTPSSLYGLHWDLGDRVRVSYANKQFNTEIKVIYVTINDRGEEKIEARNSIGTGSGDSLLTQQIGRLMRRLKLVEQKLADVEAREDQCP
jgi:hypothetical protein